MEAARLPRFPTRAEPQQLAIIGLLVALAAVGWIWTDDRMGGMDGGPGTDPGTLGFFLTTWAVMMAAMMFPSVWPTVLVYRRLAEARREQGKDSPAGGTAMLVAGYLLAWTAAGLVGYAVIEGARSLSIDWLAWDRGGRWVAAGVILLAAVYQLTPLKDACLTRCRGPLGFFIEHWRGGRLGALRMGAVHGAWCIGCCWALMAALFALGIMSVAWMAVVAGFIAVEKLLPWRVLATGTVTVLLVVLGLSVAIVPDSVPALTVPDDSGMGHDGGMKMHDDGGMKMR
jgi:predicted metal-binding membrane protein